MLRCTNSRAMSRAARSREFPSKHSQSFCGGATSISICQEGACARRLDVKSRSSAESIYKPRPSRPELIFNCIGGRLMYHAASFVPLGQRGLNASWNVQLSPLIIHSCQQQPAQRSAYSIRCHFHSGHCYSTDSDSLLRRPS